MEGILVILIYGFFGAMAIALGFFLYIRSVSSRKRYACAQCGEQQTVELMDASHCNSCGAPFSTDGN